MPTPHIALPQTIGSAARGRCLDAAARLAELDGCVVAFSGGVDSSLVTALALAAVPKRRVLAVTAVSPTYTAAELEHARAVAAHLGVRHETVATDECADDLFASNPPDRCYHCKGELFAVLARLREREGYTAIVDGANADDGADHRPGHRAATDAGVRSPLAQAGLTKQQVRELARGLGIPGWDRPAQACLASRIPYGTRITPELLGRVGRAEEAIARLGFAGIRVRAHGDVARIEVASSDLARALEARSGLVDACRAAGFEHVSLDLEGYRQGSLNRGVTAAGPAVG